MNGLRRGRNGYTLGRLVTTPVGFHGAAPTARRAGAAQAAVGTTGATNTTPYGFTTAAQANDLVALVNEMRAVLVEKGLMKGSA